MTFWQIVESIERDHHGAWCGLFHRTEHGHRFLPTGDVLTPRAYDEIRRRFGAKVATGAEELTPEERKRNQLRAKAHAAEGARYGR
ncbi:hypothetical protein PVW53_06635 [Seohaeicola sp. SP36]|uniref:hypothetical protein n=1 Tax=unclassified Seohaeicola TaxID=2641111 RepID=UPI00237AA056|nr:MULTISPECIES: hypothetical protein [unclassified Seohaeicola]MDD9706955.1 hypothetical protein [Seohaeicola sp. 4SK31]MDD9735191.1 hypothetical protein [Seohaeicola sp. SP36]